MKTFQKLSALALAAGLGLSLTATSAKADCGLIGCAFEALGMAPVGQGLDAWSRGIRERTSSEGLWNQINRPYDNPFYAARPQYPQQYGYPQQYPQQYGYSQYASPHYGYRQYGYSPQPRYGGAPVALPPVYRAYR
jgi:hypothetical protein